MSSNICCALLGRKNAHRVQDSESAPQQKLSHLESYLPNSKQAENRVFGAIRWPTLKQQKNRPRKMPTFRQFGSVFLHSKRASGSTSRHINRQLLRRRYNVHIILTRFYLASPLVLSLFIKCLPGISFHWHSDSFPSVSPEFTSTHNMKRKVVSQVCPVPPCARYSKKTRNL